MSQIAIRMKTKVLRGKRIEVTSPELTEGDEVEVVVAFPEASAVDSRPRFKDVIEFLDSLPPIERTPEEWDLVESEFREERDSWDR